MWTGVDVIPVFQQHLTKVFVQFYKLSSSLEGCEGTCGMWHTPCKSLLLSSIQTGFAGPQKRLQWFLCHHLLQWLGPEIPALLAAMGNCCERGCCDSRNKPGCGCSRVFAQHHCYKPAKGLGCCCENIEVSHLSFWTWSLYFNRAVYIAQHLRR